MPSNTFLTNQMITKECSIYLANARKFSRNIDHQYDSRFKDTGTKNGAVLQVRLPNRFVSRTGNTMAVQSVTDKDIALTVGTVLGIDLNIATVDFTLAIEDFRERYIAPQMSQLATDIDAFMLKLALGAYQTVGTYGTAPASVTPLLDCQAALDNIAAPRDGNRHALLNPIANSKLIAGMSTLYNPANTVSEQYKKGVVLDGLDLTMSQSQNVPVLTCGSRSASGTIQANAAQGDTSITVTGFTGTINAGEIIELGSASYPINLVNYETRQAIPNMRTGLYGTAQFVVTTTTVLSGTTVVPIAPVLIAPVSGVNVAYQTVDTLPVASMPVTVLGTTLLSYPINLVYHKNAVAMVSADLFLAPGGPEICHREVFENVSVRVWKQGDIKDGSVYHRIDVLVGGLLVRPELMVRLTG